MRGNVDGTRVPTAPKEVAERHKKRKERVDGTSELDISWRQTP